LVKILRVFDAFACFNLRLTHQEQTANSRFHLRRVAVR
jgi:hypothetical protein